MQTTAIEHGYASGVRTGLPAPDPVEELREGFAFLRLERVEPEKNAARFYELYWAPTLLGWAVVRTYGRIGRSQRTVVSPFADEEQAWPFIRALVKRRLRHGYRVTAPAVAEARLDGCRPFPSTLTVGENLRISLPEPAILP